MGRCRSNSLITELSSNTYYLLLSNEYKYEKDVGESIVVESYGVYYDLTTLLFTIRFDDLKVVIYHDILISSRNDRYEDE